MVKTSRSGLSDILVSSTNESVVESLIPSFSKTASTIDSLLRPVNVTRPQVFRTSTSGKSLLSPSGHDLSCDINRQVISMYLNDNYNHIQGVDNKRKEFLLDAGYYSSTTNIPKRPPSPFISFLNRASKLRSLSIESNEGRILSDQYKAYSESPFMSKALQYIEGEVNDVMPASESAKYISMCGDLGWMHAGNSIQFPETDVSTAQLAPPSDLRRSSYKLLEEEIVKEIALDVYQEGGFDGVKRGLKFPFFLSFLLCRDYQSVIEMWPSITGTAYPGYDPDNELNDQRIKLAQRLAVVLARDCFVKEGSMLISEGTKNSQSFKDSKKKGGVTRTSIRVEDEAAEALIYDACFLDLAKQLGGTDADEMTPTKEGVGACAAEEEAIVLALVLFNDGDFIDGLEGVSFMTFITKLLKTNWERVKGLINKNGNTGVIKQPPYEHTPPSDSSTVEKQQKALGDLVKQVIEFRKQEGYDDIVLMEEKRGGKRANNKAAKSTGLDSDVTESDGEETKTSKSSNKKKGKPKAVGKTAAGNGGSGNRGGSSKSSLDPFESNPFESVAKKKSSGSMSIGLKASSNKANTSTSRTKGKKQPKGQKDRASSSHNAHRGGVTKPPKTNQWAGAFSPSSKDSFINDGDDEAASPPNQKDNGQDRAITKAICQYSSSEEYSPSEGSDYGGDN